MQKTFGRKRTILFTFPLFYVKIDKKVNHISDANGEKLSEVIMNKKKVTLDYVILALGSILTALGVHFFKIPNNFSTGGFSGLGMLLGKLIQGIDTSTVISLLNIGSLIFGFLFLGKSLGIKTIYCTLIYAGVVQLLGIIAPMNTPFTDDRMLELFFSFFLGSAGAAIVFKKGGSTGGTDIVALIIRKYFKSDISAALLGADLLIVLASFAVFDIKTGFYSLLGLLLKSFGVQTVIDAMNKKKSLMIVTTHADEISKFITDNVHRGATEWRGNGVFTDDSRSVILTALSPYQAAKVSAYAKKVDPNAFIIVNNTHEIYGKGFMNMSEI